MTSGQRLYALTAFGELHVELLFTHLRHRCQSRKGHSRGLLVSSSAVECPCPQYYFLSCGTWHHRQWTTPAHTHTHSERTPKLYPHYPSSSLYTTHLPSSPSSPSSSSFRSFFFGFLVTFLKYAKFTSSMAASASLYGQVGDRLSSDRQADWVANDRVTCDGQGDRSAHNNATNTVFMCIFNSHSLHSLFAQLCSAVL